MATKVWGAGSGMDGNWNTGTNWTGDTVPGSGDDVVFDATTANDCTIDAAYTPQIKTLTVNSTYTGQFNNNTNNPDIEIYKSLVIDSGVNWNKGTGTIKFIATADYATETGDCDTNGVSLEDVYFANDVRNDYRRTDIISNLVCKSISGGSYGQMYTHAVDVSVGSDGGTGDVQLYMGGVIFSLYMGSGEWNVYGSFRYQTPNLIQYETSTLRLRGTSKTLSGNVLRFYNLYIEGDYEYDVGRPSTAHFVDNIFKITAGNSFHFDIGFYPTIATCYKIYIESGATLSTEPGDGFYFGGLKIEQMDGTITSDGLFLVFPYLTGFAGDGHLVPGDYTGSTIQTSFFSNDGGTQRTVNFDSGTYIFDSYNMMANTKYSNKQTSYTLQTDTVFQFKKDLNCYFGGPVFPNVDNLLPFEFIGTGAQVLRDDTITATTVIPGLEKTSSTTLTFTGTSTDTEFRKDLDIQAGTLDTGGKTFTVTEDLLMAANTTGVFDGSTITVSGAFTCTGTAGNVVTLTSASEWFLDAVSGSVTYTNVSYSNALAGTLIIANDGTNTDSGNNKNWYFTATANDRFWVGGGGDNNWSTANNWSLTPGGAGGAGQPNANSLVVFDNGTSQNCDIDIGSISIDTLSMAYYSGTMDNSLNNANWSVKDNMIISSTMTYTKGTGTISLAGSGSGTHIINLRGYSTEAVTVNDSGATKEMVGSLNSGTVTLSAGTLDFGGYTHAITGNLVLTAGTIDFSSSTINATGAMTVADSSVVTITLSGLEGSTFNVDSVAFNGTSGNEINLNATSSWAINATTGGTATYTQVAYSNASGGVGFIYAGDGTNTNNGNNSAWQFSNGTRYWTNGAANNLWNDQGNWAETSGGGSGVTVPSEFDVVYFNSANSVANCTIDSGYTPRIKTLDIDATYTGQFNNNINNPDIEVYKSLAIGSGVNWNKGTGTIKFVTTTSYATEVGNLDTNGVSLENLYFANGEYSAYRSVSVISDLVCENISGANYGHIIAGSSNVSVGSAGGTGDVQLFLGDGVNFVLDLGSSEWNVYGDFKFSTKQALTYGTSTLRLRGTSKVLSGYVLRFYNLYIEGDYEYDVGRPSTAHFVDNIFKITAGNSFHFDIGFYSTIATCYKIYIESGATLSTEPGDGFYFGGLKIEQMDGTITSDGLFLVFPYLTGFAGDGHLVPGDYTGTTLQTSFFSHDGGTQRTVNFDSGTYIFDSYNMMANTKYSNKQTSYTLQTDTVFQFKKDLNCYFGGPVFPNVGNLLPFEFIGTTDQVIRDDTGTATTVIPGIKKTSSTILTFTGTSATTEYRNNVEIQAGTLNSGGKTFAVTENMIMSAGTTGVFDSSAITVSGNFQSDGTPSSGVTLTASSGWTLNVSGTGFAFNTTVSNSNAGGGSEIKTQSCTDSGGNTNWNFVTQANRYWVATSNSTWNNTANWSILSGSPGGAPVPAATDEVYFDANGTGDCEVDVSPTIIGLTTTGYTGTIDNATNNPNYSLSGNLILPATMTWTPGSGTITMENATAGTQTIDTNNKTIEILVINDVGSTKQLLSTLKPTSFSLLAGILDTNNQDIDCLGNFTVGNGSDFAGAGLTGSTVDIAGNISLVGSLGNNVDLNALARWYLNVTGTATANYVSVAWSDASGGTRITPTVWIDNGDNINWGPPEGGAAQTMYTDDMLNGISISI